MCARDRPRVARGSGDGVLLRERVGGRSCRVFNDTATYRNTWAPEFARGLGHFVKANDRWSTYYPFMVANAEAAWASRRTDKNVAWNAWTQPTPATTDVPSNWDDGMVAMLQFTPASEP